MFFSSQRNIFQNENQNMKTRITLSPWETLLPAGMFTKSSFETVQEFHAAQVNSVYDIRNWTVSTDLRIPDVQKIQTLFDRNSK